MPTGMKRTGTAHDVKVAVEELTAENSLESPVIQNLRRQVANAFVLYTNYKQYHWQTHGPLFRDLHLMFDEFAQQVLDSVDHLAVVYWTWRRKRCKHSPIHFQHRICGSFRATSVAGPLGTPTIIGATASTSEGIPARISSRDCSAPESPNRCSTS